MTGLPEGFEPDADCGCEWCSAWRKKEKAKAERKEKINPDGYYIFDSVNNTGSLFIRKSVKGHGVYFGLGYDCGLVFSFEDTRKLARVLKAMSK